MLRLTMQSTTDLVTLKLEGTLASAWVSTVTSCAQEIVSTVKPERVAVDLTDVTYVDDAGKALLGELASQGVHLISDDPAMDAVVEQIARRNVVRAARLQTSYPQR